MMIDVEALTATALGFRDVESYRDAVQKAQKETDALKAEMASVTLPNRWGLDIRNLEAWVPHVDSFGGCWCRVQRDGGRWTWLGWRAPSRAGHSMVSRYASSFAEAVADAEAWRAEDERRYRA